MECPNQEKVDEHHETLYDSTSGLVRCVHKKVSWKELGGTILILLAIFTTVTLYAMDGNKEKVEKISHNTQQIAVIQKELEHISASQSEMKESIKRIEDKQITKIEIIDAVRKALRD